MQILGHWERLQEDCLFAKLAQEQEEAARAAQAKAEVRQPQSQTHFSSVCSSLVLVLLQSVWLCLTGLCTHPPFQTPSVQECAWALPAGFIPGWSNIPASTVSPCTRPTHACRHQTHASWGSKAQAKVGPSEYTILLFREACLAVLPPKLLTPVCGHSSRLVKKG